VGKTLIRNRGLIALVVAMVLVTGLLIYRYVRQRRPIVLMGAIVMQDSDPRKAHPISGVEVTELTGLTTGPAKSDANGFFLLHLRQETRRGHPLMLKFVHADYYSLEVHEYVSDRLYIIHMIPTPVHPPAQSGQPETAIGNVRVRYSVKTKTEANVGSAVKTFEVENRGNVPCKNHRPCSPDGRWKAAIGSTSLDAGTGNEFRDETASCIAGPCPFARIESSRLSRAGQVITVFARDWSDTTTFLVQAEVFHPMVSDLIHEFYPVIFGKGLSFTLPAGAEGITLEADVNNQRVFFPLGPALFLSWATCTENVNRDGTRLCRCELNPGYRFQ
jgi:hypothetical protein